MIKTRLEAFSDGVLAILVAFSPHWASKAIYVVAALIWFNPDQRIERALARKEAR
jgi:hypothetical protein